MSQLPCSVRGWTGPVLSHLGPPRRQPGRLGPPCTRQLSLVRAYFPWASSTAPPNRCSCTPTSAADGVSASIRDRMISGPIRRPAVTFRLASSRRQASGIGLGVGRVFLPAFHRLYSAVACTRPDPHHLFRSSPLVPGPASAARPPRDPRSRRAGLGHKIVLWGQVESGGVSARSHTHRTTSCTSSASRRTQRFSRRQGRPSTSIFRRQATAPTKIISVEFEPTNKLTLG